MGLTYSKLAEQGPGVCFYNNLFFEGRLQGVNTVCWAFHRKLHKVKCICIVEDNGRWRKASSCRAWVCVQWCQLPSSLESHAQHITLFAFRKCSAQCHLNTFWWVETDRRFLTLHRVGVQLFLMHMYVCACVGGRRAGIQASGKGDFHSKQTVEAEVWLAGEYPLHSVCVSLLFDYELSSASLKWTDTLLLVWR